MATKVEKVKENFVPVTFTRADFQDLAEDYEDDGDAEDEDIEEDEIVNVYKSCVAKNYW